MLRAIAVLMAAGACVYGGCSASLRLRKRYAALSEVTGALARILLMLPYTCCKTQEMLLSCGERETKPMFERMAEDVAKGCAPMEAWEHAENLGLPVRAGFTEADRRALSVFFSLLGMSDRTSQIQHVNAALTTLSMQRAEAKSAYENNGRVYRTMGLLLGAGAAILLL